MYNIYTCNVCEHCELNIYLIDIKIFNCLTYYYFKYFFIIRIKKQTIMISSIMKHNKFKTKEVGQLVPLTVPISEYYNRCVKFKFNDTSLYLRVEKKNILSGNGVSAYIIR